MEYNIDNAELTATLTAVNLDAAVIGQAPLEVAIGESARIDVGEAINYVKSGAAEIAAAVQEGTTAFDLNAEQKTADFNDNASNKTAEYNQNADNRLSEYNANDVAKTAAYNQNASDKTDAFNTNAENQFDDYNANASNKLNAYNDNATAKVAAFDNNAATKTQAYNDNATAKTTAFNENAAIKQAAVDASADAAAASAATAKQYAIGVPSEPSGYSAKYWAEQTEQSLSGLQSDVADIQAVIPASATASNKLTDKSYVDTADAQFATKTDLSTGLAAKQNTLVSGRNIKTINGQSVLGSGDLTVTTSTAWGSITGTLSAQTDLQNALNAKANTADIPTATSDLLNDSGFITLSALTPYATQNWVENKGYLTEIPAEYVTDSELTAKGYQTAADVETAITAKGYTTMSAVEAKGYITNAALVGYATESYVTTAVGTETTNRQNADNNLQSQIDAITASSDVTDIVGTYADLQSYDTSTLPPNSIIKVLQDESRNNETTYYRWVITGGVGAWSLIGEEGPYYTISAADAKFATQTALSTGLSGKQDTISDLATIRSGASAGATAVQPSDLATVATSGDYADLSGKPDLSNYVTTNTTQTISGDKIFTQFTHYQTDIAYTETPSSNKYGGFNFLDKNNKEISAFYSALYSSGAGLAGFNLKNKSGNAAELCLRYDTNGDFYTRAPTPTETTTTSGRQIATTGWVNSVDNNVVHKTGDESINGYKTFLSPLRIFYKWPEIILVDSEVQKGTVPPMVKNGMLEYTDQNRNLLAAVIPYYMTSKETLLELRCYSAQAASDTSFENVILYGGTGGQGGVGSLSVPSTWPNGTDNTKDLGKSWARWKQLYAGTTSINTSDERVKQGIEPLPDDVLDAWGDVEFYRYKFNDAIEEKGFAKARYHTGMVAQRIERVFAEHGLNAFEYGLLCYDEWEAVEEEKDENGEIVRPARAAGNRYSLRYEECLCMEAAYQRRRADRIEARLAALEARL